MAPKCVVCYVCGREYGTRSIGIHESQCLTKWKIENRKLPPNQRRRPPVKPQVLPSISGRTQHDIDRWNEIAAQSAAAHMACCENCGRTFNPDRLSIHLKSCKPGNASKPVRGKEGLLNSRSRRNVHPGYEDEYEYHSSADITEYVEFDDDYNSSSSERTLTNNYKNHKILQKIDVNEYPGPHKSPRRNNGNNQQGYRTDRKGDTRRPADYKPQSDGFKFANKPGHRPGGGQFVHCYICNQKFTTASIKFHEPSCLKKWHITQEQLPPHLRQRPPIKPKEFDMMFGDDGERGGGGRGGGGGGHGFMENNFGGGESTRLPGKGKYNINAYNAAMQKAAETNMAQCPHCKRTFNPDRIQRHEAVCRKTKRGRTERSKQLNKKGPSASGLMPSASKKSRKYDVEKDRRRRYHSVLDTPQGRRHGFVICPGCGRQYTHASIQIHLPRCGAGAGRRMGGKGNVRSTNYERESGPSVSFSNQCQGCGRTFAGDRLEVHQRVCLNNPSLFQSRSPRRNPPMNTNRPQPSPRRSLNKNQIAACPNCGRQFKAERLPVHMRACRK
ncbi:DgyrCDS13830 [Dimorphilus gyrociliatus]|uniref:DgyrCDS13830 n=1 Tax=Dimorphilus gyrociliatus TaxID=2664684 RepID=A0A7I8WC16_9ANNE|nr:DgyrCDS13830 [Dimorphilus gyrociliatus]